MRQCRPAGPRPHPAPTPAMAPPRGAVVPAQPRRSVTRHSLGRPDARLTGHRAAPRPGPLPAGRAGPVPPPQRARAARWPPPPPGQREPSTGPPRGGAARAGRLRGARTALPARQRGDPGTRKSDSRTKWAGTENVSAAVRKAPAALCVSALPAVVAAWGPCSSPGNRPELPPRSQGGCGGTRGSKPLQPHGAV